MVREYGDFKERWKDTNQMPKRLLIQLNHHLNFLIILKTDQYFEEEFNYDEVLKLPPEGTGGEPPEGKNNAGESI